MPSRQRLLERTFSVEVVQNGVFFSCKLYITLLWKYFLKNHCFQLTQNVTRTDGMTHASLNYRISSVLRELRPILFIFRDLLFLRNHDHLKEH